MRAAIVGAGLMGGWHARELERASGAVVGVCDTDISAARRLAGVHDAIAFADYDRMLAQVRPEIVHVCSPPASHVELAERALRSGAHVIVEKPVAPTAAETAKLLQVAESCDRRAFPVHQYLFQRSIRTAAHSLQELGSLLDLSWLACSAGATGESAEAASTVAADILDHPLSVLQRLLSVDLAQLQWSASQPAPGELRAYTATGATSISIMVSMAGRPTRNELRVLGTGGTLHADLFHGYAVLEPKAVSKARKIARPFTLSAATAGAAALNLARRAIEREPAYPGLRTLIAEVYRWLRESGPPPISHDECLSVARARDRLLEAAGY